MKTIDIVKESLAIKNMLKERLKELNISYNKIIKDAKKHNIYISKANLSIYFNKKPSKAGYLTQRQILWLCFRYGIDVTLAITKTEYDEKLCFEKLKLFTWNNYNLKKK